MFCCSPAAFIGEFDVEVGPKMKYVSEYYVGNHMIGGSWNGTSGMMNECPRQSLFHFVCGETLMGNNVATGCIQSDCDSFLFHIASRVLTALTKKEEDAISFFRESSDSPAVASISFCLADVCARGQRRRFCVVFIHDSEDVLLPLWPFLQNFTLKMIGTWKKRCADRRTAECSYAGNAGAQGLRCFANLISPSPADFIEKEKEMEGLLEVHSFFESLLPIAFSSPLDSFTEHKMLDCGKDIEMGMRTARSTAVIIEVKEYTGEKELKVDNGLRYALFGYWAFEFLGVPPNSTLFSNRMKKLQLIVFSLLAGVQIAVSGGSSAEAASFVVALEGLLPRSSEVNSVCYANSYISPKECRVISFSNEYLERTAILPFESLDCKNGKKENILDTRRCGSSVLHVLIDRYKLVDVVLHSPGNGSDYRMEMSTISSRVVHLIQRYSEKCKRDQEEGIAICARDLLGLHAEIYQVILEYQVKGGMIFEISSSDNRSNRGRLTDSTEVPLVKGEVFQCFVGKDNRSYAYISTVDTPA